MRLPLLAAALILFASGPAGCGGTSGGGTDDAALLLDRTPNGVHVGIYTAVARDFDGAEGVRLRVRTPSASTDPVRQLTTGRAELAILDINELARARERGRDVVGVMAVVQRPLAAVLARPSIGSPRRLEGRRVGVDGTRIDEAVLDSVVRGARGSPGRVRRTAIGRAPVSALLAGRVDAVTAPWHVEGVAARRRRPAIRRFRLDEFGAPLFPGLVLAATSTTVQDEPDLIAGTVAALRRGTDEALLDPELAVEALVRRRPGLEREAILAQLRAVQGAFKAGAGRYGELDRARLDAWARWAQRFGVVRRRPDIDRSFRPRFAAVKAESEE